MSTFRIGQGAQFSGTGKTSLIDVSDALAGLTQDPRAADKRQAAVMRMTKPLMDELTGVELYSPALMQKYRAIQENYNITPDRVHAAMQHYIDSGDMMPLNDISTDLFKFKGDEDVLNILRANEQAGAFMKNVLGNKTLKNVQPLAQRAWMDHMETGSTDGLRLNFQEINLDSYVNNLKDEFTFTEEKEEPNYDLGTIGIKKVKTRKKEDALLAATQRLDVDPAFRDNVEGVAVSGGIETRTPDGEYSDEFYDFFKMYMEDRFAGWGGESVSDLQNPRNMTKEQIARAVAEGKMTEQQASKIAAETDAAGNPITPEAIEQTRKELGLPDTPLGKARAAQELKRPSSRRTNTSTSTKSEKDPNVAKDRESDPDAWYTWVTSKGFDLPEDDVSYWHDIFYKKAKGSVSRFRDMVESELGAVPTESTDTQKDLQENPVGTEELVDPVDGSDMGTRANRKVKSYEDYGSTVVPISDKLQGEEALKISVKSDANLVVNRKTPDGGFESSVQEAVERILAFLPEQFNTPDLILTSAHRTKEKNAAVGGVENSRHTVGAALDFSLSTKTGREFNRWLKTSEGKAWLDERGAEAIDEGDHIHMQLKGNTEDYAEPPVTDSGEIPSIMDEEPTQEQQEFTSEYDEEGVAQQRQGTQPDSSATLKLFRK